MILEFQRNGARLPVVEHRDDGWPLCPQCEEDELACIRTDDVERQAVDLCYRCGPVVVVQA